MQFMLSNEIQLEILNEVIKKTDGKTRIEIDLTDPDRKHNFDQLDKDECFIPFTVEKTTPFPDGFEYTRLVPVGIAGLSDKGYKRHLELSVEAEKEQLQREHNELLRKHVESAEEANRKADEANRLASEANSISARSLAEAKKANDRAWWARLIAIVCAVISSPLLISWISHGIGWFFGCG